MFCQCRVCIRFSNSLKWLFWGIDFSMLLIIFYRGTWWLGCKQTTFGQYCLDGVCNIPKTKTQWVIALMKIANKKQGTELLPSLTTTAAIGPVFKVARKCEHYSFGSFAWRYGRSALATYQEILKSVTFTFQSGKFHEMHFMKLNACNGLRGEKQQHQTSKLFVLSVLKTALGVWKWHSFAMKQ